MKEFIKKFETASAADNYLIADIPFTTSVITNPIQNLVCNQSGKKLVNVNGIVEVQNAGPVILNDEIHYTATSQVTPTATDVFGEGVTYLPGESKFDGTTGEGILKFDSDVTSIGMSAFKSCSSLISIEIPNSVISIREKAFQDCTRLTSVTIPNSVTSIGSYAFQNCTSLTSIEIPDSVTSIGEDTFAYCTGLTSVFIPDSVENIERYAFGGCTGLTAITCEATEPPSIEFSTWHNVDKTIPVYVPTNSVSLYQQAQYWDEFTNIQANI